MLKCQSSDLLRLELVVEPWIDGLWEALERVLKEVHQGTSSADMCEEPSQHCTDSSVVMKQEVEDKVTAGRCVSDFDMPINQDKILPDVKPSMIDQREESPTFDCSIQSSQSTDSSVVMKQEVEDKVTAGRCVSDFDMPMNQLDKILPDVKPTMIDQRKETLNFDCSIQSSRSTDVPGSTNITTTTAAISSSEVVNILAMDVRNQLAVSSPAMTSSDCSTPVFNELEQSLQTSPSELRGMQLSVPSLQPAFIKVELVKVCKVKVQASLPAQSLFTTSL